MFYILLIIPHVAAIGGLLWFAYRSGERENDGGTYGDGWGFEPDAPTPPEPSPPAFGPPLPDAVPPRRRLAVGEQLPERRQRPGRREHRPGDPGPRQPRAPRSTELLD